MGVGGSTGETRQILVIDLALTCVLLRKLMNVLVRWLFKRQACSEALGGCILLPSCCCDICVDGL